jgi:uncharacterized protein (TIGR03435 family)
MGVKDFKSLLIGLRTYGLLLAVGFWAMLGSWSIAAQSRDASKPDVRLSFDVASVRPSKSSGVSLGGMRTLPGGTVLGSNVSLRAMIYFAYGLSPYEKIESKSNLIDQNFEVSAKAPSDSLPASGTVDPLRVMMQNLLAERFKLVVRFENRAQPGYALTRVSTDGPLGPGLQPAMKCDEVRPTGVKVSCATRVISNELRGDGQDLGRIALMLSVSLGQPVLDKTGLQGWFDVRMTFDQRALAEVAGRPRPRVADGGPSGVPSLFTAIQQQLGLKLEPQSVPTRVLVVERVDSLSEN